MNIVQIVPTLIKGGGERVAATLANEAAKAGHSVTMLAATRVDPALLQNSLHPRVAVEFVADAHDTRLRRYTALPRWLSRRNAWLAEQDIVHCHLTFGAVLGTAIRTMRGRASSRPAVVETYHGVGMPMSPLKRWIHAQLAARRDAFVLMGSDDYWTQFSRTHADLLTIVIPNGVSDPAVSEIDAKARLAHRRHVGVPDDARYVVGTVGMLRPDRRPAAYIPIFAQIVRKLGRSVHFVMAGAGPELDNVNALVKARGLESQVHLPGVALEPRLPLSIMDLYITLNVGPVTGLAAIEAAFAGVPIIAMQLQAHYSAQPSDWIWSSTDAAQIAARAVELLNSPAERRALAQRQKDYVSAHHSIEAMVRSYASLYDAAIGRAAAKAR